MLNKFKYLFPMRDAAGTGGGSGDPAPAPTPAPAPAPAPAQGKTYSEDYVKALSEESKNHRLEAKGLKESLRKAFNLKDDEEIGDISARLTTITTSAQKSANDKLILAELRAQAGYDHKLVERLLDKSKLTVEENGDVKGLKEALESLEKEFPQIKITDPGSPKFPPPPGNPTPPAGGGNEKTLADDITARLFGKK